jgi:hypothetical protein
MVKTRERDRRMRPSKKDITSTGFYCAKVKDTSQAIDVCVTVSRRSSLQQQRRGFRLFQGRSSATASPASRILVTATSIIMTPGRMPCSREALRCQDINIPPTRRALPTTMRRLTCLSSNCGVRNGRLARWSRRCLLTWYDLSLSPDLGRTSSLLTLFCTQTS